MVDLAPLFHHKITATPASRLPFAAISCRRTRSVAPDQLPLHITVIRTLSARQLGCAPLERARPQGSAAVHQVASSIARIAMRGGGLEGAIQPAIVEPGMAIGIRFHNGGGRRLVARGSLVRLLGRHHLGGRLVLPGQQR